jgi:hypothetical protein
MPAPQEIQAQTFLTVYQFSPKKSSFLFSSKTLFIRITTLKTKKSANQNILPLIC